MQMINKLAILGPGLLGGSIALAVQKLLPELQLSLWGRRQQPIDVARGLGISGATTSLEQALDGADLCILATPVGVMPKMVEQILEIIGDHSLLLTDVGSVKRLPHASIVPLIQGTSVEFIGSHPMAGSEKAGMEAARVDLLTSATCLITNDEEVAEPRVLALEEFWKNLGCITRRMSAEDHDYAVARVSHFPHLLASVGASVGLSFEDIVPLSGGGMRDTTRVAAGDPDLWTEILMENRDALQRSLRESIADLVQLMDCLEKEDRNKMHQYLELAQRRRALLK